MIKSVEPIHIDVLYFDCPYCNTTLTDHPYFNSDQGISTDDVFKGNTLKCPECGKTMRFSEIDYC